MHTLHLQTIYCQFLEESPKEVKRISKATRFIESLPGSKVLFVTKILLSLHFQILFGKPACGFNSQVN